MINIAGSESGMLAGKWAVKNTPQILKKLGVKDLPEETVRRVTSKEYPSSYSTWFQIVNIIFTIVVLVGFIAAIFIPMMDFPIIQKFLYGNGSIYFEGGLSMAIFGLIIGVGSFAFFGPIWGLISWSLFPPDFKDYCIFRQIHDSKGYHYDEIDAYKKILIIGVFYFLIFSPILIFILPKDYQAVFSDKIIYNHPFSISNTEYKISDVNKINIVDRTEPNSAVTSLIVADVSLENGKVLEFTNRNIKALKDFFTAGGFNVICTIPEQNLPTQ